MTSSAKAREVGSALPREDIEYAIADFLESRAKGGYDMRRTGGDMTNGKAMNANLVVPSPTQLITEWN